MEYYRTEDGQIQADLARRLGILLKQYHTDTHSREKYEVTLCIAVLQTLSTNCVELLNTLPRKKRKGDPLLHHPIECDKWGFDEKNIVINTFQGPPLTADKVFRHIRNALSHPTKIQLEKTEKATGYITLGQTDSIEKVKFISSPDLTGTGKARTFTSREVAERKIQDEANFPADVQVRQNVTGRFEIYRHEAQFFRIFEIDLTPGNLLTLAYSLADYLSHPLIKSWDGETFDIKKIAA